ncbi:MAG: selenium-dependent molybdenum cofactor biosynthesis protein YqeB [Clostridiaceae bacterium]
MEHLVIVRGGGDIATATIYRLVRSGFPVLVLETESPSAIRRKVAFSEAVYEGKSIVENMECILVKSLCEAYEVMKSGKPAMMVDKDCRVLEEVRPFALVDGILAKKNLGTNREMAEITIAMGPGFEAGKDVDLVIETMRGHDLGRMIEKGFAVKNTGIPGMIAGFDKERVIHAETLGILYGKKVIGDFVNQGECIAEIVTDEGNHEVKASISGILRGLIRDGYPVTKGFKIADIDPRTSEKENCYTISDKARCIAGSVLEGILYLEQKKKEIECGES